MQCNHGDAGTLWAIKHGNNFSRILVDISVDTCLTPSMVTPSSASKITVCLQCWLAAAQGGQEQEAAAPHQPLFLCDQWRLSINFEAINNHGEEEQLKSPQAKVKKGRNEPELPPVPSFQRASHPKHQKAWTNIIWGFSVMFERRSLHASNRGRVLPWKPLRGFISRKEIYFNENEEDSNTRVEHFESETSVPSIPPYFMVTELGSIILRQQ